MKKVSNSVIAQSLEFQVIGISNIEKLIFKVIDITPQHLITQCMQMLGQPGAYKSSATCDQNFTSHSPNLENIHDTVMKLG
jgi:hypothetical protein